MDNELEDMARSAFDTAMSFGVTLDSFFRLAKSVKKAEIERQKVRYAPACEVTQGQRDAIPVDLYAAGDAILVWANEGDLVMYGMRSNA